MGYIVALDDGHGLETSGKRTPDGYKENEFNNGVKQYLINELRFNGFSIVDCSPDRSDNTLADRVQREINGKADIFVSIHFNAMGSSWNNNVGGIETYYNAGSTTGKRLADLVHGELIKGTPLKNRGVKADTTLYSTGLYVLAKTKSPAILVECGFMDNPKEAALMASDDYKKECSKEIAIGICKYFGVTYKENKVVDTSTLYIVQAGAFNNKVNADRLVSDLKRAGFSSIIKTVTK